MIIISFCSFYQARDLTTNTTLTPISFDTQVEHEFSSTNNTFQLHLISPHLNLNLISLTSVCPAFLPSGVVPASHQWTHLQLPLELYTSTLTTSPPPTTTPSPVTLESQFLKVCEWSIDAPLSLTNLIHKIYYINIISTSFTSQPQSLLNLHDFSTSITSHNLIKMPPTTRLPPFSLSTDSSHNHQPSSFPLHVSYDPLHL